MGDKKKSAPLTIALRLLNYRDRSAAALRQKLLEKGLTEDETSHVIQKLTDEGLLDDERFARALTSSRIRNKNWGPRKISMDLIRKGLPRDIVNLIISELDSETIIRSAKRALEKWSLRKGLRLSEGLDANNCKKAYNHLEARGFNSEFIMKVIRKTNNGMNIE